MKRPRFVLLAPLLAGLLGCAGAASPVRRAVQRGDLTGALRLYNEYVEERGDGDPDLLAEVALATLRDAAASGDARTRASGFSALRGLGPNARDTLEALARRDGVVGDRAAAILFEFDGRRGAPPPRLRAALRSADVERRIAGLVWLRGRRGGARLAALSTDPEAQLRSAVARELARRRGDASAAQALSRMARDDADPMVRAAAVMALGAHGHDAVEALAAALADRDPIVRMAVPAALASAAPDDAEASLTPLLVDPFTNLSIETARVLASHRVARAEEYVLDALRNARPELRPQAAVAAQSLADERGAALGAFLFDADPEVAIRVGAILVRREAYRQASIEALRPIASRPDGFVAIRALGVLAGVGDPWALDPIRQALTSSDANVRRLAVLAWPNAIGPSGSDVDALAPLLRDSDRSVALLAALEIVVIAERQ